MRKLLQHLILTILSAICLAYTPPPNCLQDPADFGYVNGSLSSTQTFLKCLANIPDAAMFPSYYNGMFNYIVGFSAGLTLSDLVNVSFPRRFYFAIIISLL